MTARTLLCVEAHADSPCHTVFSQLGAAYVAQVAPTKAKIGATDRAKVREGVGILASDTLGPRLTDGDADLCVDDITRSGRVKHRDLRLNRRLLSSASLFLICMKHCFSVRLPRRASGKTTCREMSPRRFLRYVRHRQFPGRRCRNKRDQIRGDPLSALRRNQTGGVNPSAVSKLRRYRRSDRFRARGQRLP